MTQEERRRTGLILGLVLGLGYSITSNLVNRWMLPEINFFEPWPGTFGVIVLSTLMFGLLGLIAAWPEDAIPGVIFSGLVGSLISSFYIALTETVNRTGTYIVLFIVFLPRVFFYAPLGVLLRWLIGRLAFNPAHPVAPARRLVPTVLAVIAFTLFGFASLLPEETRLSLTRMEKLIQMGMQATSREELPEPLKNVEGFLSKANGVYSYEIGRDPDLLPVQRPIAEYGESEPFLIIRFESGFRFGCVFSPPYVVPACIDY